MADQNPENAVSCTYETATTTLSQYGRLDYTMSQKRS